MIAFLRSLYLRTRLFVVIGVMVVIFALSAAVPVFFFAAKSLIAAVGVIFLIDVLLLYQKRNGIYGIRVPPDRLSNGDDNEIKIFLENNYPFPISLDIIDEIPHQFQKRDLLFKTGLSSRESKTLSYDLKPTERGEYSFGGVNVYAHTFIGLVSRK